MNKQVWNDAYLDARERGHLEESARRIADAAARAHAERAADRADDLRNERRER